MAFLSNSPKGSAKSQRKVVATCRNEAFFISKSGCKKVRVECSPKRNRSATMSYRGLDGKYIWNATFSQ
ncbi:MAG: hypothetical protein HKL80_07990 [Acidimicrobiales bacterium]|nr:hypothetical protein [Acidimicrobiales bacterium]